MQIIIWIASTALQAVLIAASLRWLALGRRLLAHAPRAGEAHANLRAG